MRMRKPLIGYKSDLVDYMQGTAKDIQGTSYFCPPPIPPAASPFFYASVSPSHLSANLPFSAPVFSYPSFLSPGSLYLRKKNGQVVQCQGVEKLQGHPPTNLPFMCSAMIIFILFLRPQWGLKAASIIPMSSNLFSQQPALD